MRPSPRRSKRKRSSTRHSSEGWTRRAAEFAKADEGWMAERLAALERAQDAAPSGRAMGAIRFVSLGGGLPAGFSIEEPEFDPKRGDEENLVHRLRHKKPGGRQ